MGLDLDLRSRTANGQRPTANRQPPPNPNTNGRAQHIISAVVRYPAVLPIARRGHGKSGSACPGARAIAIAFSYNTMKRTWCRLARVASHPPTLMLGQTTMKLNTLQKRLPRTCPAGFSCVPSSTEPSWLDNAIVCRDIRLAPFIPARGPHP
jgi:hypothetical protein